MPSYFKHAESSLRILKSLVSAPEALINRSTSRNIHARPGLSAPIEVQLSIVTGNPVPIPGGWAGAGVTTLDLATDRYRSSGSRVNRDRLHCISRDRHRSRIRSAPLRLQRDR